MKYLLLSRRINLTARLRFLDSYVWSVLLYNCKTWTISEVMQNSRSVVLAKVERCYRYQKSYEEIFKEAQLHRTLLKKNPSTACSLLSCGTREDMV